MKSSQFDVIVIGAGVVGCAIANRLISQTPRLLLLEAQSEPGQSTSDRNSGVIHSGLYYPQNFLKTSLCIDGQNLLYEWADKKGLAYRKIGKLIVATSKEQGENLNQLYNHARLVGCRNVSLISGPEAAEIEPYIKNPFAALYCQATGIIRPKDLTDSLYASAVENGAIFKKQSKVTAIEKSSSGEFSISTDTETFNSPIVINSAGLGAAEIAKLAGVNQYKLYPCRGDYFKIDQTLPFRHLIYPVKEKGSAGLGIHLTLDLDRAARLGPDAEYIESIEDTSTRDSKKSKFWDAASHLLKLPDNTTLSYAGFGIRPKLSPPGEEDSDFIIRQDLPGFVNLVGIESPGLTASLAIADYVQKLLT
jgi:L-2-hydroxyglutarate oxidase LhgO